MKHAVLVLLVATACGDINAVYVSQSSSPSTQDAEVRLVPGRPELLCPEWVPDPGTAQNVEAFRETGNPNSGSLALSAWSQALCLSPDPSLERWVRDSAGRFRDRLQIPVVLGEACLPIVVRKEVSYQGKLVSALARYSKGPCVWKDCEASAVIEVAEINLTEQQDWLPNLLDHEIGHVLSSWGSILKVPQHLPEEHIMAAINKRDNSWTQEDIDMWCSGAPCGNARMNSSWLSPVADSGTSLVSDEGTDGGVPADAGSFPDAN